MTLAELSQLTDQNAQLTSQLEDLEKEATKADEIARRKLGKLEREIERLKGDLDNASEQLQQKETEIERSSEAKRQRLERDERLSAMRGKQQQQHPEVVDFSPPPIPVRRFTRFEADESNDEPVPFPSGSHNSEVDLISQLMNKIRELEEANREIIEQQNESVKKLKKAMIGAEGMRKVYDYLSDDEDLEVEIVEDDEFIDAFEHPLGASLDSVPEEEDLPIRFSSIRRTINEDIHKRLATELSEDDTPDHAYDEMKHAHPRSRGSIAGLFDSPERRGRTVSIMDQQDEDSDDMDDSKIFSRGVSPIGSPLLMPQDPPAQIRSLGSELGSEYGDDRDGSTSEHRHVRTTSILSLTALIADNSPQNRTSHSRSASKFESSPTPTPKRPTVPGHQRSSSMRDKDRSLDTATFDKTKSQLRSRMLSQTISARSTRWSDGRLEDIAFSASRPPRLSAPLITEMFQSAVEQVTGSSPATAVASPQNLQVAGVSLDDPGPGSPRRHDEGTEGTDEAGAKESVRQRTKFNAFVLEIWLWLQFILIILVFVLAVARRGPRNVLKEGERKRA
jgi:hypothetical protein